MKYLFHEDAICTDLPYSEFASKAHAAVLQWKSKHLVMLVEDTDTFIKFMTVLFSLCHNGIIFQNMDPFATVSTMSVEFANEGDCLNVKYKLTFHRQNIMAVCGALFLGTFHVFATWQSSSGNPVVHGFVLVLCMYFALYMYQKAIGIWSIKKILRRELDKFTDVATS